MLTPKQEKWVAHLKNNDRITIRPYDTTAPVKFEAVKRKIQSTLGDIIRVERHGATSLKISGQNEIDIYIPSPAESFDFLLLSFVQLFGNPRSLYPTERVRFVTNEDGKHIDVFLINEISPDWINMVNFEKYLRKNPKVLGVYRKVKEEAGGLSTQEYYRRKIEFINTILINLANSVI